MRISTSMIYDKGLGAIQKRTASVLETQQQVSSQRRILKPSDDPVAAARVLEVSQAQGINASYAKSRTSARNSLGIADSQLDSVTDLLTRVRELSVQGGNATLSAADRKSVATELRARFDELVAIANSTDGTGNYLFAGYQTDNKPFSGSVEDGVIYSGDSGLRSQMVSSSRNLPISYAGSEIFMGGKAGNGVFATGTQDQKPTLAPSLTLDGEKVTDATAWAAFPGTGAQLRFWNDPAGTSYYDLVDTATGNSLYTGTPSTTANSGYSALFGTPVVTPVNLGVAGAYATGSVSLPVSPPSTDIRAGVNDKFIISVDGGAPKPITLAAGSYTVPGTGAGTLGEQMQIAINGALGGGVATVSLSGSQLVVTSNSTTAASAVALANANTYTHAYTSGTAISLSSTGTSIPPAQPAFDYGASVTVAGTPASGNAFSIARTASGGIQATAVSARQAPVMDKGVVTDLVKWSNSANNGNFEVRFWVDSANAMNGGANAVYYDLVDATTGKSLYTGNSSATGGGGSYTHAFTSGTPISFSGLAAAYNPPSNDFGASVTVTGTPANGDTFTIVNSTAATGNGYFETAPKLATRLNSGSGIVDSGQVLDQSKWNNPANSGDLEVRFWKDTTVAPAVLYYDLVDASTQKSLFTNTNSVQGGLANTYTHSFTAGNSIPFKGLQVPDPATPSRIYDDFGVAVTISGTPDSGDVFTLKSSPSQSIFDTLGQLVTTLETGIPPGTAGNTQLANQIGAVLKNISQAEDAISRVRANIGTGLSEIDTLDSAGESLDLLYQQSLSDLQDVDMAKAITDLMRQKSELDAAQQSFMKVSGMSLFDYLR